MKNALILYACLISIILSSSCAVAMGTRRECDSVTIPARPPKNLCISNGDGSCEKWNSVLQKNEHISNTTNYICKDISDYNREQEWIDSILLDINNGNYN